MRITTTSLIAWTIATTIPAALATPAWANSYPEHYAYDPAWNGGSAQGDTFIFGGENLIPKAAKLADGSVVVVGLVSGTGQSSTQATNIGLVHFSASGSRLAWSSPDAGYASDNNMHVTYPNNNEGVACYQRIDDVKVNGHFIYILSDCVESVGDPPTPMLDIFSDTGKRVIGYAPFGWAGVGEILGAGLAFNSYTIDFGGGPVTISRMKIAATNSSSGRGLVVMQDYPVNSDGTLGTIFKGGGYAPSGTKSIDLAILGVCTLDSAHCSANAKGLVEVRDDTSTPTIYVYGSATTNDATDGSWAFILPVDYDGNLGDSHFGSDDSYSLQMGNFFDSTFGLVALKSTNNLFPGDTLYLGMNFNSSTAKCGSGYISGVQQIYNELPVNKFNWGLSESGTVNACDNAAIVNGNALASDGTRLVIAGGTNHSTPGLATILQSSGAILDIQSMPWLNTDGTPWDGGTGEDNYSNFNAVVPVAAGKYVVAGTAMSCFKVGALTQCNDHLMATTQLVSDTIFANGFDAQ